MASDLCPGDRGVLFVEDADGTSGEQKADHAILVCTGAGMGVDSGLPDFRGNQGFWRAYPPYRERLAPVLANPRSLKVGQNLKYDLTVLQLAGMPVVIFCQLSP